MSHGTNGRPPVLPGCSVLSPMEPPRPRQASTTTSKTGNKPKRTAGAGDRFSTINTFVDFTLGGLTRNEAAVWLVLWRDTKNETARTAQTDIARRAGIGRRTVVRIVAKLETKGLLQMVHQGGLNRGMNVYRVLPLAKPLP
ncbi:MAG: helix-turn-helix domain-containing protein [Planctomycetota bacterium]